MDTKCEKVKAESKISEKKKDFGDKTGRTRRKMIKMRIQPASVFVDEGEDKIEVGKVSILYYLNTISHEFSCLKVKRLQSV